MKIKSITLVFLLWASIIWATSSEVTRSDTATISAGKKGIIAHLGSAANPDTVSADSLTAVTSSFLGSTNIVTASNFKLAGTAATFGMAGLNAVTDGSVLTTQHYHSALSASDGTPANILSLDAAGVVGINDATPGGESVQLTVYDNTAASLPVMQIYQDNASATGKVLLLKNDGSGWTLDAGTGQSYIAGILHRYQSNVFNAAGTANITPTAGSTGDILCGENSQNGNGQRVSRALWASVGGTISISTPTYVEQDPSSQVDHTLSVSGANIVITTTAGTFGAGRLVNCEWTEFFRP